MRIQLSFIKVNIKEIYKKFKSMMYFSVTFFVVKKRLFRENIYVYTVLLSQG